MSTGAVTRVLIDFSNGERTWTTSQGEDKYRRGLYTLWRRTVPYPSMAAFDAPSREICTVRRVRTNTPLQAFVTLNDPVYVEASQGLARRMAREGGATTRERVLAAVPRGAHVVTLDGRGKPYSSEQLGQRLEHWRQQGRDLAFLVGGPEGHCAEVIAAAGESWSLGPLTLPHMLVRLVLAEQLYRAASLLANHPYHRA